MSWKKLFRRKIIDRNEVSTSTELHRVLSTLDLTLLGIGSTLGTGIYVLAGQVAKMDAGPAVVISFLVAAIASVLAGLCYAEFGARVPKAGSAYVYSYVCVGEIIAFIVGWNLVMEYVIGVASVSKAYSGYVDTMIPEHAMSKFFREIGEIHVSFLGEYFDFFAFGITIVLTLLLMFGVKESSLFNNFFTVLNLLVMFFVIIAGGLYSNIDNWAVDPKHAMECKNVTPYKTDTGSIGTGGFTPFGFSGIMAGAATCFYGFIGFDVIATTGEEAKNPRRAIPISIVVSLLFIFIAYFGISTVLTMMVPYYCQYGEAPLPYAFEYNGFTVGKMVVNIGALFALATSLLGSMFPMPRIIYSMARDGLLFNFLAKVHPRFQTPIWATLIGGLLGAVMGALFNLSALIDMMSIGTLTAYTLVALCVLMLRYRKDEQGADDTGVDDSAEPVTLKMWFRQIFNLDNAKVPTKLSTQYTTSAVIIYCILCFAFCGTAILSEQLEGGLSPEVIALLGVFGVLLFLELVSLSLQPISRLELTFKVPLVPWIPGLSILVNTYLILELSWATWVRFAIWMVVGLVIYLYCLLTGRADTTYEASYQEFQNNSKNTKRKISLQGIDNPALVYDAQDEHGTMHKEKPQSKNKSDKEKDSESKKDTKTVEDVHITKAKSILVNSQKKIRDSTQKSGAPPVTLVPASPGFEDEILKIHESNQKYINERDEPEPKLRTPEDVVDSVIAKAIQEAQAIVTNYPQEASKLVNHVVTLAEQQDSLQKIHRACQDCLNVSTSEKSQPLLSSHADREETQLFLQDHLRKSLIKNPPVPPQENQENGNEISEAGNVNKMEDDSKRLEYIHMVAQLCLNGVNLESVPWPLDPPNSKNNYSAPSLKPADVEGEKGQSPELITAIMDQLRQNGVNLESVPWPIEATSQETSHPTNTAHSESKSDIDRINTIAQLSQNGVNIESIPWPIEPVLSTEGERELTKNLTKQLEIEPEGLKETPPLFTSEQLTQVLRVHDEAQRTLNEKAEKVSKNSVGEGTKGTLEDPADINKNDTESTSTKGQDLLDLHKIAQLSINGVWPLPSQVVTNDQAPSSSDSKIVVVESQGSRIVPEGAPAGIKSNAEIIHAIAQLCLQGINIESVPWLDPVLSSSAERNEIKGLNQLMLKNSKQTPAEENAQPQADAPPSPSAEQITELLEIHNAAQEVLRASPSQNKEVASTKPEDASSTSNENRSEPLESESERIHKINELCLSGISVPWLRPILSSNEEKEKIKELNRRATAEAFRKPAVKIPAQEKNLAAPRSSHDVQADMENLARAHHNIAHESLGNNSSEDSGTVADVDFDTERPSSSQSDHNSSQMKEPLFVKNKNKARETARKKVSTVSFHESPKIEELVIPRNSGSEDDEPEEEEDIPKRRLQYRRPTGPFLPQLNKLNLDKTQSDLSEDDEDDDEDENDEDFNTSRNSNSETESSSGELEKSGTDVSDNSYPLKANEEPQAATPRKQSIQNKKPMDDLIAIFEQGK